MNNTIKYLGGKTRILKNIEDIIDKNIKDAEVFCDLFAGSCAVSQYFKNRYTMITNDILYSSLMIQLGTIANNQYPCFSNLKNHIGQDPIDYFNSLDISRHKAVKPFIYDNYSPNANCERMYFTNENALKIDYIRRSLNKWLRKEWIKPNEYHYLIACLLKGVSLRANTSGHFFSYFKHWEEMALIPLKMIRFQLVDNKKVNKCYFGAVDLIDKIEADILYLDPPYNSRHYNQIYHLLETISKYDYPEIHGKTGQRKEIIKKSIFNQKEYALKALTDLIENAKIKHIVLSFSTEGFIPLEDIKIMLKKYAIKYDEGNVEIDRYKSKRTGSKEIVSEHLFYIEKEVKK